MNLKYDYKKLCVPGPSTRLFSHVLTTYKHMRAFQIKRLRNLWNYLLLQSVKTTNYPSYPSYSQLSQLFPTIQTIFNSLSFSHQPPTLPTTHHPQSVKTTNYNNYPEAWCGLSFTHTHLLGAPALGHFTERTFLVHQPKSKTYRTPAHAHSYTKPLQLC